MVIRTSIILIALSFSAIAQASGMIKHKGIVKSYDGTYVRLMTKKGEVRVPKKYLSFEIRNYLHEMISKEVNVSFPIQDIKSIKYAKSYKKGS